MRKPLIVALAVLVAALGGTSGYLYLKNQKTTADFLAMKDAEEQARSRYGQTIDAIAEIQDSLNSISAGDKELTLIAGDLSSEQRLSGRQGREALDRISDLRASILRSKQRILQLESAVKASGVKQAGLQRLIAQLKTSVEDKQLLVAQLTGRVDTLQTQVAGLTTEVEQGKVAIAERDQSLEVRRQELATVYYVIGDKKELTDAGVIEARGGLLGIGKTLTPAANASSAAFTPLDTDANKVVRVDAPKARVLSAQPASSYELVTVGDAVELHILDPIEFRKVKHLVIVTA